MMTGASKNDAQRGRLPAQHGILIACFYVFLTMVLTSPIMVEGEGPLTGDGNIFRQVIYTALLGVVIYAVRPREDITRLWCVPVPLLIALAYCAFTLTWSLAPGIGIRRLALTGLVIWTIFLIVSQLGYSRVVPAIRIALVALLAANFVAVFAAPEFGIHQMNNAFDKHLVGAWRGVMMQKNFAGAVCAITILFFLLDADKVAAWIRGVVVFASAVFLWFCESRTSAGVAIAALAGGLVYMLPSAKHRKFLVPAFLTALILFMIMGGLLKNPIEVALGDPESFTGRGRIWQALWGYSQDHLLTGSGYGSFWNIGLQSPVYRYAKGFVTTITAGHNGYLDLLASVGLLGLLVILFACVVHPLSQLLVSSRMGRQQGALLSALLTFCVGHNGTESSLFDRDTIVQVFLMLTVALIAALATSRRGSSDVTRLWHDLGMRSAET